MNSKSVFLLISPYRLLSQALFILLSRKCWAFITHRLLLGRGLSGVFKLGYVAELYQRSTNTASSSLSNEKCLDTQSVQSAAIYPLHAIIWWSDVRSHHGSVCGDVTFLTKHNWCASGETSRDLTSLSGYLSI